MARRIICIILSLTFILSLNTISTSSLANALKAEKQIISDDLQEKLDKSNHNELIDVYVWISDIDHKAIEEKTLKTAGFSKINLIQRSNALREQYDKEFPDSIASRISNSSDPKKNVQTLSEYLKDTEIDQVTLAKDIDTYIMTQRYLSSVAYTQSNETFVEKNLSESKIRFISRYAPLILCSLTKEEIESLAKANDIQSIMLQPSQPMRSLGDTPNSSSKETSSENDNALSGMSISVPYIDADFTKRQGFRGYNIKIGQIETATPMTNTIALSGKSIITRGHNSGINQISIDHATMVATILISSEGLAPEATLYSAPMYYDKNTNTNDLISGSDDLVLDNIEWLIDQGVSIINRSAGRTILVSDPFDPWINHIVSNYNVTFVQAVGNAGYVEGVFSHHVWSNALNAISVGAIDTKNTVSTLDDTIWYRSCYICRNNINNRPDVVAPGTNFTFAEASPAFVAEYTDGTSYSAPIVSGVVAQMMGGLRTIMFIPDAIKAAVISTCYQKITPGSDIGTYTEKEGAGIVNAILALDNISRVAANAHYETSAIETIYTYTPDYDGEKVLVFCLLTEPYQDDNSINVWDYVSPHTDFTITVYDSNGNEKGELISTDANVAIMKINVINTESYTIKITKSSRTTTYTYRFSLATPW